MLGRYQNFRDKISEITIKDVIPYSRSEKIKVKWQNCTISPEDDKLGIYTWEIKINPDEKITINYKYSIEWEKEYRIEPPIP